MHTAGQIDVGTLGNSEGWCPCVFHGVHLDFDGRNRAAVPPTGSFPAAIPTEADPHFRSTSCRLGFFEDPSTWSTANYDAYKRVAWLMLADWVRDLTQSGPSYPVSARSSLRVRRLQFGNRHARSKCDGDRSKHDSKEAENTSGSLADLRISVSLPRLCSHGRRTRRTLTSVLPKIRPDVSGPLCDERVHPHRAGPADDINSQHNGFRGSHSNSF